jgi:uncharacterized lipoprotein
MKKMRLQAGALSLILLLLSGCSLFDDHSQDYLQTQSVDEIVLPADLKHLQIQEKLVVPAAAQPENLPETFEAPRPAPLDVASMQTEQTQKTNKSGHLTLMHVWSLMAMVVLFCD